MDALFRELRHSIRTLRRAPSFALAVVVALALGIAMGISLLSLARSAAASSVAYTGLGSAAHSPGDWRSGWTDEMRTIAEIQDAGLEALLLILLGVTVLAIGVVVIDLLALLLARASARRQEMALRAALGAPRRRVIGQLLIEGALPSVIGAGAGLLLGLGGAWLLGASWPDAAPPWSWLGADPGVVGVVIGALALITLLLALAPSRDALRRNLHEALGASGRATPARGEEWVRNALVVAQVAASLTLLTGAGLLLRSSSAAEGNRSGIDPRNVVTLEIELARDRYTEDYERVALLAGVLERVGTLPGVDSESIASTGALLGLGTEDHVRTVCPECSMGLMYYPVIDGTARHSVVSPGFFDTLRVPVVRGRTFRPSDTMTAPRVAVINQVFGYRLFPNGDPLGKKVQIGGHEGDWYTVVGIVENVRPHGIGNGAEPAPGIYLSALQHPPRRFGLALRAVSDPAALVPAVENAVHEAGVARAPSDVMTLRERIDRFEAPLGWFARVFAVVAAVAVILAGVGLYGVMSYNVERRTREVGVRMALGAGARRVMKLIMEQSLRLTALGSLLGLMGALSLARLLHYLFHGIRPLDPVVYGGIALLLGLVAVVASWRPARHATRIDPAVALRAE